MQLNPGVSPLKGLVVVVLRMVGFKSKVEQQRPRSLEVLGADQEVEVINSLKPGPP